MPRIAGVNIPDNKRIEIALTYVYGIGDTLSREILSRAGIDASIRAGKLTPEQVGKLRDVVEKNYKIEGELRQIKLMNIKRLKDTGSYRGTRHARGLPVRGQRTKTNTRTVRGNKRVTVGSGRKAADKK